MGICFSCGDSLENAELLEKKKKQKELDDEAREIQKQNLENIAKNWLQDTKEIWTRDFTSLPIHTDLPRLGNKMAIYDKDGNSVVLIEPGSTKQKTVQSIVESLSRLLEEPEQQENITNRYSDYVLDDGDMSQQLIAFLGDVVGGESKTMKVLKTCHQKLILPGYYYLKSHFFFEEPFRDKRGTWTISIYVNEENIEIIHEKRQQSQQQMAFKDGTISRDDCEFEFSWRLKVTLSQDLSTMEDISVTIFDVKPHHSLPKDRKKELKELIFIPIQEKKTESNLTSSQSSNSSVSSSTEKEKIKISIEKNKSSDNSSSSEEKEEQEEQEKKEITKNLLNSVERKSRSESDSHSESHSIKKDSESHSSIDQNSEPFSSNQDSFSSE